MGDNTIEHKMADKFVLEVPTVTIPEGSPEWAAQMFPSLIKSIYDSINGVVQGMVIDYNHRFKELQSQMDEQSKQNEITKKDLIDLRSSVSDKDFIIDNQNARIAKLQAAVDKNESYSRRSNLIFGGIAKDVQGSCTAIVHSILKDKMNIANATSFKLVRCHFLSKPTDIKKGSIIAQFESFSSRMTVWSKKRALMKTDLYLSEDYPSEVNKIRSKLRPILKEASKHTEYASCISIKYDKLHFKGELLSIDNLHKLPDAIHPQYLSERRSQGMLCFGGVLSDYHQLSNYYPCKFAYKGNKFTSIEQAYQYCKAMLFNDERTAALILHSNIPSDIKQMGQQVTGFDAACWNQGRDQLMKALVMAKFFRNNNLKKTLCDTGTRHLAEASRNDQHFGIGIGITHPACLQKNNWKGGNKLGEALMDARKELRKSK